MGVGSVRTIFSISADLKWIHEVTLVRVGRFTEIQVGRSTTKAFSSGVSMWKAVSSASTRHFAKRYSRQRCWKNPLGLGGASGVRDEG